MKILFLSDDFPPASFGGAGISTYELALGMEKAGHEVFVITTCRKESEAGEFEYNGLKIFKIASDYFGRWRAYLSINNRPVVQHVEALLQQIRPDVVHANNIHAHLSYACLKVAKKYVKAVVFTARDVMTFNFAKLNTKRYLENLDCRTTWRDHIKQAGKRWNPFRNFFIKKYLGYADKIFSVSDALRDALAQNGISGVKTIHTGIEVATRHVSADAIATFRKRHALERKKIIFFAGRLSAEKGGTAVLGTLAEVSKEMSDVVLLVAGSIDEYAQVMQEQAKKFGMEKQLIFTGWIEQEEVKVAYAVADIILVPSMYLDPFPRMVIEAMGSGKSVIGTCYGGAPEIIVNGVTGYIVNPFAVTEMAEKTLDLLKNPQKAKAFGQAGYERVIRNFNLEDKVKEYIAIYKALLEKVQ